MCKGEKCCLECSRAKTDYYACDRMCSKAKAVRKEKRDDAKAKELSREEKVQAKRREEAKEIASRLVKAADLAGAAGNCRVQLGRYGSSWSVKDLRRFAAGDFGDTPLSGWEFGQDDVERFAKAAETLGCSVDYIMGLTDEVQPGQSHQASEWFPLKWLPGKERPHKMLDAVCVFDLGDGNTIKDIMEWNGEKWIFPSCGEPVEFPCLRWFPIPEDDEKKEEL